MPDFMQHRSHAGAGVREYFLPPAFATNLIAVTATQVYKLHQEVARFRIPAKQVTAVQRHRDIVFIEPVPRTFPEHRAGQWIRTGFINIEPPNSDAMVGRYPVEDLTVAKT